MDKLDIFNKALAVFNIAPIGEDEIQDSRNPDIAVLNLHLGTAIRKASREFDWSFLVSELSLSEDMGPHGGYQCSYKLPDNLFRLTSADGSRYRRVNNWLLTDGKGIAYGILDNYEEWKAPEDFWELVAYNLAIFASAKLSPGDDKVKMAVAMHDSILATMIQNECQGESSELMGD